MFINISMTVCQHLKKSNFDKDKMLQYITQYISKYRNISQFKISPSSKNYICVKLSLQGFFSIIPNH